MPKSNKDVPFQQRVKNWLDEIRDEMEDRKQELQDSIDAIDSAFESMERLEQDLSEIDMS